MIKKFFSSVFTFKNSNAEGDYLKLSEDAYRYYIKHVRGNEETTLDQARRKMERNMRLAMAYKKDSAAKKHPRTWYAYGCLRFIVKNGEVTWMLNKQPMMKGWYKDYAKYETLNDELEIKE